MPKPVSSPCTVRCLLHSPQPSPASASASSAKRVAFASRQTFNTLPLRPLAQPHHHVVLDESCFPLAVSSTFFSHTSHRRELDGLNENANNDHKPPDERVLKLGQTLRILSPLLPTLLINPLSPKILSPNVALHLFPSTHPHLPTVKGRTLYRAALWTVPVAWSSVPLFGNVRLQILSERIVRAGTVLDPDQSGDSSDCGDERLVVRWRTEPRSESHLNAPTAQSGTGSSGEQHSHLSDSKNGVNKRLSVLLSGETPIFQLSNAEQFTGLFIFSFDEEGRILSHTIEHADDANGWDRTSKFVTLTDWLIGKARGSFDPSSGPSTGAGLAFHDCPGFSMSLKEEGGSSNCR